MDREEEFKPVVSAANPLAMVTISCALGERRQMQMAINISCADPVELQNEMLDRAMLLADRQQARYDLEKLEENFNIVGLNTRNFLVAYEGAGLELKTRVARLKVELEAKEEARKEIHDAAYADHMKERTGPFKPKGFVLQKLNVADAEIAKTKAAIEAAPKDAEQERAKNVATIQRQQEDLRLRRKQINDLRKLAGLSPNEEFMDAETAKV